MHSNTTIQDYRLSEHERQYKQARLSDSLQRGALRGRRGMRQTVISTLMHAVVALLQPSLKCGKLCVVNYVRKPEHTGSCWKSLETVAPRVPPTRGVHPFSLYIVVCRVYRFHG